MIKLDRLDYELEIIDILDEACNRLNSEEFEKLITRVVEVVNYYE